MRTAVKHEDRPVEAKDRKVVFACTTCEIERVVTSLEASKYFAEHSSALGHKPKITF